ncbi:PilN domain-containing protein [Marinobacter sp. CHS3-4]|uniref:PilN domain-containing protein n=1 Tax=Marinobacter sp. CHS3-4 TaxID=3045174 RepID=UPI0024B4819F|nr:PilN domain-containing protein [Marinobacter sp. CHS3-4]MDI9246666.1 PilN domain-containing protein [Marinobacter sp. CHS3-4]
MVRSLITKIVGRSKRRHTLYLEIRPDGIAWATPGNEAGFIECSPAKREQELAAAVEQNGWTGASTTLVLPLDQYQVFQLDRPEGVEESELGDALKWKLKDFLDFSPSDAVSDVFPFPKDASRGRGDLVNVVAARKSLVRELVDLVENSDLELVSIDIAELALRHLVARLDESQRGAALVHMRGRYGQMVVCKGDVLYLSRRLDVAAEDLHDASRQENAVQSLALEMQRSLDYYESQLGQVPPALIRFVTRDTSLPLSSMLGSYLAGVVEPLDWSDVGVEDGIDSRCLVAWSASLAAANRSSDERQEVDLYVEELRPRKEKLQAGSAVALLMVVLLFLIAVAGFVRYQNAELTTKLADQQRRTDQLQQTVDQLTREAEARQPDPQIEAALQRVNDTLIRRQRLLAQVERLMTDDSAGFAASLSALARQVPGGLWLTRIQLNSQTDHVALNGRTQAGQLVPQYLEALGEEPAFQGRTFGLFRLDRGEDKRWIEFSVATDQDAEDAE